jgi:hypothetical protein
VSSGIQLIPVELIMWERTRTLKVWVLLLSKLLNLIGLSQKSHSCLSIVHSKRSKSGLTLVALNANIMDSENVVPLSLRSLPPPSTAETINVSDSSCDSTLPTNTDAKRTAEMIIVQNKSTWWLVFCLLNKYCIVILNVFICPYLDKRSNN